MPVNHELRQAMQDRVTAQASELLAEGQNVLVVSPTGSGKTNMFTDVIDKAIQRNPQANILVMQDRIAVAEQNKRRAESLGHKSTSLGIAGNFDQSGQIVYALPETVMANVNNMKMYDLLIVDECQHASDDPDSQHSAIISAARARNPKLAVMGATATHERPDGKALHPDLAQATMLRVTYKEALRIGAIVPTRTVTPYVALKDGSSIEAAVSKFIDPTNPVETQSGIQSHIRKNRPADYHKRCVQAWAREGGSQMPTFAYTGTIEDAESLAKSFKAANVAVQTVHSKMPKPKRDQAFADYRSGKTQVLVSVDMLIEGVDETKTACILNAKEITSRAEKQQMEGRGMRAHTERDASGATTFDKTECLVIDMGASTTLHGRMEDYIEIEAYLVEGSKASSYRPWRKLSREGDSTEVIGLHTGDKTLFAVRPEGSRAYLLFEKTEGSAGRKQGQVRDIKPARPHKATSSDLSRIGHEAVRQNVSLFTVLESTRIEQPTGSQTRKMRKILMDSFKESKGSLLAFTRFQVQHAQNVRAVAR
ncbi:DEAD/DEAH box helicase [Microvirga sp. BT688]|uniref:DEAD/DEAH box helicase n=1 Tax=Microvirga sp. TaxID=1873136 RepID=UPI00168A27FF|nr:DEAD/DEAH box helicase [Microvirga sp.]MBD2745799.1 DEAD/DEAH box helicase [Microvirga sp.]